MLLYANTLGSAPDLLVHDRIQERRRPAADLREGGGMLELDADIVKPMYSNIELRDKTKL